MESRSDSNDVSVGHGVSAGHARSNWISLVSQKPGPHPFPLFCRCSRKEE